MTQKMTSENAGPPQKYPIGAINFFSEYYNLKVKIEARFKFLKIISPKYLNPIKYLPLDYLPFNKILYAADDGPAIIYQKV